MFRPLLIYFVCIWLCNTAMAQVDTLIGSAVPAAEDYKATAKVLCARAKTETAKVNAIYNWVTHNISYDIKASKDPMRPPAKAEDVFRTKMGACDGYTALFAAMCRASGFTTVIIEGYTRDWFYDANDSLYIPRHAWCAVMIYGKWQLVDPTWGAGYVQEYNGWLKTQISKLTKTKPEFGDKEKFVFRYNPKYFMTDPLEMRMTHLPADPQWQLTQTQMPLRVLERGPDSVVVYNELHKDVMQDVGSLVKIGALDDYDRQIDYAERAYKYNPRYVSVIGYRDNILAHRDIDRYWNRRMMAPADARVLFAGVKKKAGGAADSFRLQKKLLQLAYTELDKKNTRKNNEAKDYIRKIRMDDKQQSVKIEKYKGIATRNMAELEKKLEIVMQRREGLAPEKIDTITTSRLPRPVGSPELVRLGDSVRNRNTRIDRLGNEVRSREGMVIAGASENYERLQQLAQKVAEADSLMLGEAEGRVKLHDVNDEDVKVYNTAYLKLKFSDADTLQKYVLVNYDTVAKMQDGLLKNYMQLLDLYKANLKDMEQHRKFSRANEELPGQYAQMVMGYIYNLERYKDMVSSYIAYEKNNITVFSGMQQSYEHELKVVDEIEELENTRYKMEERDIAARRDYDNKEMDKLIANAEGAVSEADKMLQTISK